MTIDLSGMNSRISIFTSSEHTRYDRANRFLDIKFALCSVCHVLLLYHLLFGSYGEPPFHQLSLLYKRNSLFILSPRNFNCNRSVLPDPESAVWVPSEIFCEKCEILYTQKYPVHDLKHKLWNKILYFHSLHSYKFPFIGFNSAYRNRVIFDRLPNLLVMFGTVFYW
jgi:hypothetical protein